MKRVWAIDGQLVTLDCQEARTIQDSPGPFVHVLPCQYRRNTSFLLPDKINLGGRVCGSSCLSMQSTAVEKAWWKSLRWLVAAPARKQRWMLALRSFLLPILIQFLTPARGRVLSTFRVVWKCFYRNSQASCLLGLLSHFKVTVNIYLH